MAKKKSRVAQKTRKLQVNVMDLLEMPADVMLDLPKLTMIGRQKLLLENHRGIIEYGLTKVRVKTTAGLLTILGEELVLKNLKPDEMLVEGKISSLTLED